MSQLSQFENADAAIQGAKSLFASLKLQHEQNAQALATERDQYEAAAQRGNNARMIADTRYVYRAKIAKELGQAQAWYAHEKAAGEGWLMQGGEHYSPQLRSLFLAMTPLGRVRYLNRADADQYASDYKPPLIGAEPLA